MTDPLYRLRMIRGKSGLVLPEWPKSQVIVVTEAERQKIREEARARALAARAVVAGLRARDFGIRSTSLQETWDDGT